MIVDRNIDSGEIGFTTIPARCIVFFPGGSPQCWCGWKAAYTLRNRFHNFFRPMITWCPMWFCMKYFMSSGKCHGRSLLLPITPVSVSAAIRRWSYPESYNLLPLKNSSTDIRFCLPAGVQLLRPSHLVRISRCVLLSVRIAPLSIVKCRPCSGAFPHKILKCFSIQHRPRGRVRTRATNKINHTFCESCDQLIWFQRVKILGACLISVCTSCGTDGKLPAFNGLNSFKTSCHPCS